jgi:hypothetical protein
MPLGLLPLEGSIFFTSGAGTRKARNLARNPNCVITVATAAFDLVIEGRAARVTDLATLRRIAEAYAAGGWPARVNEDARALEAEYSAPSAGPAPWDVYEVTPEKVFALGTAEPSGATRFDF